MLADTSQSKLTVPSPDKSVWRATAGGFVFTVVYVLAGIWLCSNGEEGFNLFTGIWVFVVAGLFLIGSLSAMAGNHSRARVLWLIGGYMGLPLGLVMVGLANQMNAAIKATEFSDLGITPVNISDGTMLGLNTPQERHGETEHDEPRVA